MSNDLITQIILAVPAFVASLAAWRYGKINHEQGVEIHLLTNSKNAILQEKLDAANLKIEGLVTTLVQIKTEVKKSNGG